MSIFKDSLKTIILSVLTLLLVGIAYAWTEPGQSPPGGNLSAPITISSDGQTKSGNLVVNSLATANGLIVQNGNVGIGTTGPDAKLSIREDAGNAAVNFNRGGTVYGLIGINTANDMNIQSNTVPLRFSADGFANTHMQILANGNVGIGTASPGAKLHVAGDTPFIKLVSGTPAVEGQFLAGSSGGIDRVAIGAVTNHDFAFWAGGGTKMTIKAGGNVGIGTTDPGAKLDINGKMRFRSSFTKYDSYGPYSSYQGNGPFWNDGATWGCTCRNSQNRYIDSNTCNYNSLMSGGNNTTNCIYTATIANTTIFNKIIECGIGDFNGTFQCTVIQ